MKARAHCFGLRLSPELGFLFNFSLSSPRWPTSALPPIWIVAKRLPFLLGWELCRDQSGSSSRTNLSIKSLAWIDGWAIFCLHRSCTATFGASICLFTMFTSEQKKTQYRPATTRDFGDSLHASYLHRCDPLGRRRGTARSRMAIDGCHHPTRFGAIVCCSFSSCSDSAAFIQLHL